MIIAELDAGNITEAEAAGAILWVANGAESIIPSRSKVNRKNINLSNGNQRQVQQAGSPEAIALMGGVIPSKDMGALASQAGGWC